MDILLEPEPVVDGGGGVGGDMDGTSVQMSSANYLLDAVPLLGVGDGGDTTRTGERYTNAINMIRKISTASGPGESESWILPQNSLTERPSACSPANREAISLQHCQ
jgi:hypothetical protein